MAHVLFHRPTIWNSDVQCSTKVLARLCAARGHRTDYLHAPLDPAHLLRGRSAYWRLWRQGTREAAGVRVLTPVTPVPVRDVWPLNTLTAAHARYRACRPSLSTIGAPDLVWTTVPGSGAAMKRTFPRAKVVFHVVDYYPAFRGEAVKALERDDYFAVDAVATISGTLTDYLINELGVLDDKVTTLGQGVEIERYAAVPAAAPAALKDLPRPRAVWSGVLAKGDPILFGALAETIKERGGTLVLIGPSAPWADALAARHPEHVLPTGPVAPADLPSWLAHCDLGIMLYDRSRQSVYRGQNPLKLYEYAAAGLPILSTHHDEFDRLSPPAIILSDEHEVRDAVKRALDDVPLREAARQFATAHSWRAKLDEIIHLYLPEAAAGEA